MILLCLDDGGFADYWHMSQIEVARVLTPAAAAAVQRLYQEERLIQFGKGEE